MLFTSPIFLFGYLPVVLTLFLLMPRQARLTFLLVASLAFYAWSERRFVLVLIVSILLNTGLAFSPDEGTLYGGEQGKLVSEIERGERFVGEDPLGLARQHPRQQRPGALAA